MKHRVSRDLHAYWNRLRGTRAAPERSDIDPASIRTILADTFLADIVADGHALGPDFIIRLAGTRLNGLWGEDLSGRSLTRLWREKDRPAVGEILALVVDDQVPVVAGARAEAGSATALDLEVLFLPLRHNGKTHARMFGSIVPQAGSPFTGLATVGPLILTSFRSITGPSPEEARSVELAIPHQHGRFTVYEGGR